MSEPRVAAFLWLGAAQVPGIRGRLARPVKVSSENSLAQGFAHQLGFLTRFSGGKRDLVFVCPQEMIPFAVVGSDQEYQVNGRRILGRKTKWGTIEGSLPLFPHLPSPTPCPGRR